MLSILNSPSTLLLRSYGKTLCNSYIQYLSLASKIRLTAKSMLPLFVCSASSFCFLSYLQYMRSLCDSLS